MITDSQNTAQVVLIVKNERYTHRILELIALHTAICVLGVAESGVSEETKVALLSKGYQYILVTGIADNVDGKAFLYYDPLKISNEGLIDISNNPIYVRLFETKEEAESYGNLCAQTNMTYEVLS